MVKLFLSFVISVPLLVFGQYREARLEMKEEGIHFEDSLSWHEILGRAKAQNKFIFLDCYTTWCGPCKFMRDQIFKEKQVGDYFNDHFINVAVQMDKTSKDLPYIKKWYNEADSLNKAFGINSYPTYLFFSPDGKPVHRFVGATGDGKKFLSVAYAALDQEKRYYYVLKHWQEYKNDSIYLDQAVRIALAAGDERNARIMAASLLDCVKSPISEEYVLMFSKLMNSRKDVFFRFVLDNHKEIDDLMGDSVFAEVRLAKVVFKEGIMPLLIEPGTHFQWNKVSNHLWREYSGLGSKFKLCMEAEMNKYINQDISSQISKDGLANPDWSGISYKLDLKYNGYDWGEVLLLNKVRYYGEKKEWENCEKASVELFKKYGDRLNNGVINYISWNYLFLHSKSPEVLQEAIKWMKFVIDKKADQDDFENFDTYANLLYKAGQNKEALAWEAKAIDAILRKKPTAGHLQDFKTDLNKMQRGEPTWEGQQD